MASIRSRHHFLQKLTGKTKPEEESSYEIANKLALALPLCSLALCALEAVLYFVYNRQVIGVNINMSLFPTCTCFSSIHGAKYSKRKRVTKKKLKFLQILIQRLRMRIFDCIYSNNIIEHFY